MNYQDLLELVESRRSIRAFKPDPIPDEWVEQIVDVARWAPSGFNTQPWEFVIVKKPELREQVVELVKEYGTHCPNIEETREPWLKDKPPPQPYGMSWANAPVFIILFGDTRTKDGLPMRARIEFYRAQWLFVASLANAFLYMHLAAKSLGLASQWVTAVKDPWVTAMLQGLLNIPREWEAFDMMPIGFPDETPRGKLMRDKEKMIHYDGCRPEDTRSDEEVHEYIRNIRTWGLATEIRAKKKS